MALLVGCAAPGVQRHAWVTGLKPEKAERYRELHAAPWPSVNQRLKECHIRNFSIHEREIDGKLYLFAYLEYTGKDFDADMKRMADDPETQRWWKETDPASPRCPTPPPRARFGPTRKNCIICHEIDPSPPLLPGPNGRHRLRRSRRLRPARATLDLGKL
jgi:L-rhamnose mutarotase